MQQCVYETKICDIDDLQKRLMQTWFDFEQNIIDAAIVQWLDRLRLCERWWRKLWTHAVKLCAFVLCGLSEHFMKLSMQFWCIWWLFRS